MAMVRIDRMKRDPRFIAGIQELTVTTARQSLRVYLQTAIYDRKPHVTAYGIVLDSKGQPVQIMERQATRPGTALFDLADELRVQRFGALRKALTAEWEANWRQPGVAEATELLAPWGLVATYRDSFGNYDTKITAFDGTPGLSRLEIQKKHDEIKRGLRARLNTIERQYPNSWEYVIYDPSADEDGWLLTGPDLKELVAETIQHFKEMSDEG